MKNRYEQKRFELIIYESKNLSDVCRNLNLSTTYGNRLTIKNYIKLYNIDTSHFRNGSRTIKGKKLLSEILIENSDYTSSNNLKNRLYNSDLKKRECEICGQGEIWRGKKISLILDHINGINNDHRIENLRILCPNCNATLETHCKGQKGYSYSYTEPPKNGIPKERKFCECGRKKEYRAELCLYCYNKKRRINIPKYEILMKDIEELGYRGTGRKYNVSDNSIRKWKKSYES